MLRKLLLVTVHPATLKNDGTLQLQGPPSRGDFGAYSQTENQIVVQMLQRK